MSEPTRKPGQYAASSGKALHDVSRFDAVSTKPKSECNVPTHERDIATAVETSSMRTDNALREDR